MSQAELDTIVMQRFESAGRFASAVSHEVGNIVLFAEAADPDAPMSDQVRAYREQYAYMIQHFRQLLRGLAIWKSEPPRGQLASVTGWWRAQCGFLRQFVKRTVPVTLTTTVAEDRFVDVGMTTRITGALLIAIDAQMPALERLVLQARTEGDERQRVCMSFTPTPACSGSLLIPTIVADHMDRGDTGLSLSADADGTITLGIKVALQESGSSGGAPGADSSLFPK